jgi:hypothetical protein
VQNVEEVKIELRGAGFSIIREEAVSFSEVRAEQFLSSSTPADQQGSAKNTSIVRIERSNTRSNLSSLMDLLNKI